MRDENKITHEVLHQGKEKQLSFSLVLSMLCYVHKCRVKLSHQQHFNKENIYWYLFLWFRENSSTLHKSINPLKVSSLCEEKKNIQGQTTDRSENWGRHPACSSGITSLDDEMKWRNTLVIGKKNIQVYGSHWTIFIVKNLNVLTYSKNWHK